jgi:methionine-rich copper-binding protein CopC
MSMWARDEEMDLGVGVLFKQQALKFLVNRDEVFCAPQTSLNWRLVGDNTHEITGAIEFTDHNTRTWK